MATPAPRRVALLGYGGLLPFIATALGSVLDGSHAPFWLDAQIAYGAVILSFVGALHWGFAMLAADLDDAERDARYLWSVIPALLAWPARCWWPASCSITGRTDACCGAAPCRRGTCRCAGGSPASPACA